MLIRGVHERQGGPKGFLYRASNWIRHWRPYRENPSHGGCNKGLMGWWLEQKQHIIASLHHLDANPRPLAFMGRLLRHLGLRDATMLAPALY